MIRNLKIEYFFDVAEMGSFTKAAEKNFITQTAISQQIAALENELNIRLFIRKKGRVELTQAGASFYKDCKKISDELNIAISRAKQIHNQTVGNYVITIGYLASSIIEYLDEIITRFNEQCVDENFNFKPVQESIQSLRYGIKNGTLDMAIGPTYNFEGLENVQLHHLYSQKVGLLVSRKSPLSRRESVKVCEIINEPVVMTTPEYSGIAYDLFLQRRAEDGYKPNIVEWADSAEMLTVLVGMNMGVAYLPEKLAKYDSARCKMLRIEDTKDVVNISLALRKGLDINRMRVFIDLIKLFFDKHIDDWLAEYRKLH